jgi:predicted RNase H-like HicB family nuclease
MGRRKIRMEYHWEPEGWWAESSDLPGFSAAGQTFAEVRAQAHEGARFFAGEELVIEDTAPIHLEAERNTASTIELSGRLSVSSSPFGAGLLKVVRVSVLQDPAGATIPSVTSAPARLSGLSS